MKKLLLNVACKPVARTSLTLTLMLVLLTGCGKDSSDGTVTNALALPTDTVLNLFCANAGIFRETCILDDPENPYARVNVNQDTKFDLAATSPSAKARFYLWSTALARGSAGENQWYTARALHEIYSSSGSSTTLAQTLKAYRSVLDNYFNSATFFEADFLPTPGIFYAASLRELTAADLIAPGGGLTPLFDASAATNDFLARQQLGVWGYQYDEDSGQVYKL